MMKLVLFQLTESFLTNPLKKEKYILFHGIEAESARNATLDRSESDAFAAAIVVVLHAGYCVIYTDVDGCETSYPRIVPKARLFPVVPHKKNVRNDII